MRNQKDRRRAAAEPPSRYAENGREQLVKERRSGRNRRLDNMRLDERQTQLSEMPGPTTEKPR
jgi:hypothetical protein